MENVKCSKYGCKSTSFRTMADNGSTVTLKCNICGSMFKAPKSRTSTASSGSGRSVYGDRHSFGTTSSHRDDDDDNNRNSSSSWNTSDNDNLGGGSSDGGGSSSDW